MWYKFGNSDYIIGYLNLQNRFMILVAAVSHFVYASGSCVYRVTFMMLASRRLLRVCLYARP